MTGDRRLDPGNGGTTGVEPPAPRRTLVLGGARSGKSAHAEGLLPGDRPAVYVATARRDPADTEWEERIAAHEARRPAGWHTRELTQSDALAREVNSAGREAPPMLVDDLATWLTGLLDEAAAWDRDAEALELVRRRQDEMVAAVTGCSCQLVLVSAEVGLGIVPSTGSGRLFRDQLGGLNARLAEVCDEVVLLVAGVPLRLR